jgi:hypothetical protein
MGAKAILARGSMVLSFLAGSFSPGGRKRTCKGQEIRGLRTPYFILVSNYTTV